MSNKIIVNGAMRTGGRPEGTLVGDMPLNEYNSMEVKD